MTSFEVSFIAATSPLSQTIGDESNGAAYESLS